MHKFKDVNGKEWSIHLDTNVVRNLRTKLGVDLLTMDEKTITDLTTNDETLVDVISFICTGQIEKENMNAETFAACMLGDALDNAFEALGKELVFISRRSRKPIVAKALEKTLAAQETLTTKAMELLDSEAMDKKVQEAMTEMESQIGMH